MFVYKKKKENDGFIWEIKVVVATWYSFSGTKYLNIGKCSIVMPLFFIENRNWNNTKYKHKNKVCILNGSPSIIKYSFLYHIAVSNNIYIILYDIKIEKCIYLPKGSEWSIELFIII